MTAHPRLTLAPLIGPIHGPYVAPRRSVRDIAIQVSEETGVTLKEIYGRRRVAHIVRARWKVWQIARAQGLSLPQIGRATGHDHTTVLHGLQRLEAEARPETAPPRDIRGRRNGVTPEGFIAILRAECLKARSEGCANA